MRPEIVRKLLKLFLLFFPSLENKGPAPDNFKVFSGTNIPKPILESLILAYQEIFAEPPWNEKWERKQVLEKIEKDLSQETSFLSVLLSGNGDKVLGFAWGDIVDSSEVPHRASSALNTDKVIEVKLPSTQVLYFDELALTKEGSGGPDPIKHLFKMGLDHGIRHGADSTIFWSTPESRIVPIVKMIGYERRGGSVINEKEINFYFHPEIKMVKRVASLDQEKLKKIFRFFSKKPK